MAANKRESSHQWLERNRPPRMILKYDVETEDGTEVKELPFVVGVLGDYSGNAPGVRKPLKQRNFTSIDRDNFNQVMSGMAPGLNFRVENTLQGDGSELPVQLRFNSLEDFEPAKVVEQVEPLRRLLAIRQRLRDLLSNVDRTDGLDQKLEEILSNPELLQSLAAEHATSDQGAN